MRKFIITAGLLTLLLAASSQTALAQDGKSERRAKALEQFDTSNARIPVDDILGPFVQKDGIPPLTNPERAPVGEASYPEPNGRVIEVDINGDAVAFPIGILTYHEIVNDTVGETPIAVIYCPLCDSVAIVDRRIKDDEGVEKTIEFGVSGFLYNSNVVMYDKTSNGLWSQVLMQAMTGPFAGKRLKHLPVRVVRFDAFTRDYPNGEVLTTNTGHERDYTRNYYADRGYFDDQTIPAPFRFEYSHRLPPKTLGVGILAGDFVAFVQAKEIFKKPMTVKTPLGDVVVRSTKAGVQVESAPAEVLTIQTFFHSWSAFHPKTIIIPDPPAAAEDEKSDPKKD